MESILSNLMLGDPSSATFARQVKGCISVAESNIARLDAQIQDLTRLRDQERELISALTPLIAPIRKLPVELLTEIFLLAVDTTEDWFASALVVSQVCAHWRQVACATPHLWNGEIALDLTKPRSDAYLATTKPFSSGQRRSPYRFRWTMNLAKRAHSSTISTVWRHDVNC